MIVEAFIQLGSGKSIGSISQKGLARRGSEEKRSHAEAWRRRKRKKKEGDTMECLYLASQNFRKQNFFFLKKTLRLRVSLFPYRSFIGGLGIDKEEGIVNNCGKER